MGVGWMWQAPPLVNAPQAQLHLMVNAGGTQLQLIAVQIPPSSAEVRRMRRGAQPHQLRRVRRSAIQPAPSCPDECAEHIGGTAQRQAPAYPSQLRPAPAMLNAANADEHPPGTPMLPDTLTKITMHVL